MDVVERFKSGESWIAITKNTGLPASEVISQLYKSGALDSVPAKMMRPAEQLKKAVKRRTDRRKMGGTD